MKKLALVNLIVLIAIKSISACQIPVGSTNVVEEAIFKAYILSTVALICLIATVVFYSLKKNREGLIFIFVSGITLFLTGAAIEQSSRNCGIGAIQTAQIALAVAFVCFLAQFITWFMFRNKSRAELA